MTAPAAHFRPDYAACRDYFLRLASKTKGELIRLDNPAAGPDGLALSTEFLRLGPAAAKRALIMVSGTHGAEGFAGSAVQCAWLSQVGALPDDLSVVLVHGLNPYGFSHLRRVNENNVDLNRNFIDHEADHPVNEHYARLAHALAVDSLQAPERDAKDKELATLAKEMGQANVMRAIGGQYDDDQGMFYGGRIPVWSNRALREYLPKLLPNVDLAAYVDLHTGLGANGHGSLYCYHAPKTDDYAVAKAWWGSGVSAPSTTINTGKTGNGAMEALAPARVICLTLEYGTLPFEEVLAALRDEHALWRGATDGHPEAVKNAFRSAFCRDDLAWRGKIVEQGLLIAAQSIDGLFS